MSGREFNREEWAGQVARRIEAALVASNSPAGSAPDWVEAVRALKGAKVEFLASSPRSAEQWEGEALIAVPGIDPRAVCLIEAFGVVTVGELLRLFPTRAALLERDQFGPVTADNLTESLAGVGVFWPRYEWRRGILTWIGYQKGVANGRAE